MLCTALNGGIHDSEDGLTHLRVFDGLILVFTLEPFADVEQRRSGPVDELGQELLPENARIVVLSLFLQLLGRNEGV